MKKILLFVCVFFLLFSGNAFADINWTRVYEADVDGSTWERAYSGGRRLSTMTLVDIDNDGDLDMFIGESDGRIFYKRNDGTAASPVWVLITESYESIDIGQESYPEFADIDNDGDYDMFIGETSGNINYYRNDGTAAVSSWTYVTSNYNSINVGSNSSPDFADIDNDGDLDLFVGEFSGNLNYYRNDGNANTPAWTLITSDYNAIDVGLRSKSDFVDIDNDGDLDMFIGEYAGNIYYYRNDGTANTAAWTLVDATWESIDVGTCSSVCFADIDNDNDLDLFAGAESGFEDYYRNDGNVTTPSMSYVSSDYRAFDVGARSIPAFADIDDDGDLDLFFGELYGEIIYYRNDGTADTPAWTLVDSSYQAINVGGYSAPAFVDIDDDNDLDLLIGERYGLIEYYRNDGTAAAASFVYVTDNYLSYDVGQDCKPAFADIDDDGDYDLFIGEFYGNVFYYRNDGTAAIASWTLVDTAYQSIDVGSASSPDFVDIDNDGDLDMFIGENSGNLNYYRNDGNANTPAWTLITSDYNAIDVGSASSHDFVDIDNDGDLDMFIGNLAGGLNFWKANGFTSHPGLSWTAESNYTADGIDPETGNDSSTFTYRIDYTSSENNAPKYGCPKVYILKGGTDITGSPFTMTEADAGDTTFSDGKIYSYSISDLALGSDYTYYFEAYDHYNAPASGDPTNPLDAPNVLQIYSISGTITDGTNPVPDVTVDLTGDSTASTITDTNGNYSFGNLDVGATYVITPAKTNYIFDPVNLTYINLSSDVTDADFTGTLDQWIISGTITDGVNPFPDVTVNLTGDSTAMTITDVSGNYVFNDLDAGATYVITPAKTNYTFAPVNLTYIDFSGDAADADFTGTKLFATDLENIVVYPNPWKSDGGVSVVTFANLTENAIVQIYTIGGEIIIEIDADSMSYSWNLKNEAGEDIAAGVYFYVISNDTESTTGKFVIIR
ncbi:VCBS repeat-containing protein [bacterium]|nr:VCBS repeat-containing protein [bacterium]